MGNVEKHRFIVGFFACGILWMMGMSMVSAVLLPQHLRDITGVAASTTIFGYINAAVGISSLIANLLFGNLSDRTRSRFGRRTPWIFFGTILDGISLFLVGMVDNAWLIGILYCLCMFGLNMVLAPVVATLSDRVPDNIRATMSAFSAAGTTIGVSLGTLIGARFISIQLPGFATAGLLMGMAGIATILVWPREQSSKDLPPVEGGFKEFLISFRPPTKNARDFWLAFVGRMLLFFSYYMVLNYQLYILESYIGQSKIAAAATISIMSIVMMVISLIGSLTSGALSDKLGFRKLPVNFATLLMAVGYFLPWILKSPFSMILFAGFAGLGFSVYGAVDQALNVDVLPNKAQAGKDLGILNIATTLGQTAGPLVTSAIVGVSGYRLVFPVAITLAILACIFIQLIRSVK